MLLIREFDSRLAALYTRGLVRGSSHSAIGQEAVAVGACAALRPDDYITSTHRGHGHAIAKGVALDRMFAELFGREAGYCRGKGGSMHVADFSIGMLGANGIVGGGFGIAAGAALSASCSATQAASRCASSATAPQQGRLPRGGELRGASGGCPWCSCARTTGSRCRRASTTTAPATSRRGRTHRDRRREVDGMDLFAVRAAAAEPSRRPAAVAGPSSSWPTATASRATSPGTRAVPHAEEAASWHARDPIETFAARR